METPYLSRKGRQTARRADRGAGLGSNPKVPGGVLLKTLWIVGSEEPESLVEGRRR